MLMHSFARAGKHDILVTEIFLRRKIKACISNGQRARKKKQAFIEWFSFFSFTSVDFWQYPEANDEEKSKQIKKNRQ